jgi:hypothetical protein
VVVPVWAERIANPTKALATVLKDILPIIILFLRAKNLFALPKQDRTRLLFSVQIFSDLRAELTPGGAEEYRLAEKRLWPANLELGVHLVLVRCCERTLFSLKHSTCRKSFSASSLE